MLLTFVIVNYLDYSLHLQMIDKLLNWQQLDGAKSPLKFIFYKQSIGQTKKVLYKLKHWFSMLLELLYNYVFKKTWH